MELLQFLQVQEEVSKQSLHLHIAVRIRPHLLQESSLNIKYLLLIVFLGYINIAT